MSNRRAQDERIEGTPDGSNAITEIVDVPDAPTIGTATAGMVSASVAFNPATTGGTASLYTATSTPGSITGTSATSPITVSGLTAGISYTFKVKGSNSTGTGAESSASNSITPTPPMEGAYDALASVTLSANTTSIGFSGIPTGYKHLQIRGLTRTDRADTNDFITVRFNNATSGTYAYHSLYGNGSSAGAADTGTSTGTPWSGVTAGGNAGASMFGAVIWDVLDYQSTNKYKTIRVLSGTDQNATTGRIYFQSNLWQSTSAISTITIIPTYGTNFVQYSEFALYGVK